MQNAKNSKLFFTVGKTQSQQPYLLAVFLNRNIVFPDQHKEFYYAPDT